VVTLTVYDGPAACTATSTAGSTTTVIGELRTLVPVTSRTRTEWLRAGEIIATEPSAPVVPEAT
jgi:hypothetical protein